MTYAVHNIHAPAVQINEAGQMSFDGKMHVAMPEPLFTRPTLAEAEAERLRRLDIFNQEPNHAVQSTEGKQA